MLQRVVDVGFSPRVFLPFSSRGLATTTLVHENDARGERRHAWARGADSTTVHALAAHECSSPLPGLVRVERSPAGLDPVYALQTLPGAVEVSGASVKSLAAALVAALLASSEVEALRAAPRGALAVHALVPAMLRGVTATGRTKPALSRRCAAVAEAAAEQLRGQFACARPLRASDPEPKHRWLLQLLLLGPEDLVASVSMVIASMGSY